MDITQDKALIVSVLGVTYYHYKTRDGGDLYLTRFGEPYKRHLDVESWYEERWFSNKRQKLLGTSSVFKLPTKEVDGHALSLVVKYSRVGEDVPLNTHTLEQYCNAEFNSPWEEFSLVMEIFDAAPGESEATIHTQRPLAIYVPSETMQHWQSGRSRHRVGKIRARHPGIDLDILKQYILVYEWIEGKNLIEMFDHIEIPMADAIEDIRALDAKATLALASRGYYVADMKPEHVIVRDREIADIEALAGETRVRALHALIEGNRHSVIDYELLQRTPEHNDRIRAMRRNSYLYDQRNRFTKVAGYQGLLSTEVMGVPYIFGHVESTGGKLWVIGNNARLFDYFLPERWRKTNALSMSANNEVYYTVTKDNIHVVWKTSRVGERPDLEGHDPYERAGKVPCVNSPFEEAAIALELQRLGFYTVYMRAIYATGTKKLEPSLDMRKYKSHEGLLDPEGNRILSDQYNYITIRGYFNGTDEWVSENADSLYTPVDLVRAAGRGIIGMDEAEAMRRGIVGRLGEYGYDGTRLRTDDILIAVDSGGGLFSDASGRPIGVICDFEYITPPTGPLREPRTEGA